MKIAREQWIISIGYPLEVLFLVAAGMFWFNKIIYFILGIIGVVIGGFISEAIKLRERKRIQNASCN